MKWISVQLLFILYTALLSDMFTSFQPSKMIIASFHTNERQSSLNCHRSELFDSIVKEASPLNIKIKETVKFLDTTNIESSEVDEIVLRGVLDELWQRRANPTVVLAWWIHTTAERNMIEIDPSSVTLFIKQCFSRDKQRRKQYNPRRGPSSEDFAYKVRCNL